MTKLKVGNLFLDAQKPYIRILEKGEKYRSVPLVDKTVQHLRIIKQNYADIFLRISADRCPCAFLKPRNSIHADEQFPFLCGWRRTGNLQKEMYINILDRIRNVTLAHPFPIHGKDLIFDPAYVFCTLWDELRLKRRFPVSGDINRYFSIGSVYIFMGITFLWFVVSLYPWSFASYPR